MSWLRTRWNWTFSGNPLPQSGVTDRFHDAALPRVPGGDGSLPVLRETPICSRSGPRSNHCWLTYSNQRQWRVFGGAQSPSLDWSPGVRERFRASGPLWPTPGSGTLLTSRSQGNRSSRLKWYPLEGLVVPLTSGCVPTRASYSDECVHSLQPCVHHASSSIWMWATVRQRLGSTAVTHGRFIRNLCRIIFLFCVCVCVCVCVCWFWCCVLVEWFVVSRSLRRKGQETSYFDLGGCGGQCKAMTSSRVALLFWPLLGSLLVLGTWLICVHSHDREKVNKRRIFDNNNVNDRTVRGILQHYSKHRLCCHFLLDQKSAASV